MSIKNKVVQNKVVQYIGNGSVFIVKGDQNHTATLIYCEFRIYPFKIEIKNRKGKTVDFLHFKTRNNFNTWFNNSVVA